jgi:hypothetical protein
MRGHPAGPSPQRQDPERAPEARPIAPEPERGPVALRFALGLEISLLTVDQPEALRTPTGFALDLGWAPLPDWIFWLRAASWFAFDPVAFQFLGLGATHLFLEEQMFVSGFLGISILDGEFGVPGGSDERVQGLALNIEIGQTWSLATRVNFDLGVRFELGTPWLGDGYDAAQIAIGPFIAIGYR